MPSYNFDCTECDNSETKYLSIAEYKKIRSEELKCSKCKNGLLIQSLGKVHGSIDRPKEDIIRQAKEDAKKIVDKISKGDEGLIRDIYGDKSRQ